MWNTACAGRRIACRRRVLRSAVPALERALHLRARGAFRRIWIAAGAEAAAREGALHAAACGAPKRMRRGRAAAWRTTRTTRPKPCFSTCCAGSGARGLRGMEEIAVRDGVTLSPPVPLPAQAGIRSTRWKAKPTAQTIVTSAPVCQPPTASGLKCMPKLIGRKSGSRRNTSRSPPRLLRIGRKPACQTAGRTRCLQSLDD